MNPEYFRDQIKEELEGASAYAKHALEMKAMNANWGRMLLEMSAAELNHATNLHKMYDEYCQVVGQSYMQLPKYMNDIRSEIADVYAEEYAKVKMMHDAYNK